MRISPLHLSLWLLAPPDRTPARRYNFRESRQHLQSGVRLWSAAYEQLVDPPTVMPIVMELLNDDKWGHSSPGVPPPEHRGKVRLDHDNIHFRPGTNPDGGGSLHTGYSGPDCREPFPTPIARLQKTLRSAAQGC